MYLPKLSLLVVIGSDAGLNCSAISLAGCRPTEIVVVHWTKGSVFIELSGGAGKQNPRMLENEDIGLEPIVLPFTSLSTDGEHGQDLDPTWISVMRVTAVGLGCAKVFRRGTLLWEPGRRLGGRPVV